MDNLSKKYGLFTAMALVVGIVIGSGVFFKAEKVLNATGGNLPIGILAWIIGGVIMVICAYNFAVMATKYEKVNGLVDYAEEACGKKYGYFVGWFMAIIYYPSLVSVLAWVSGRYIGVLLGFDITSAEVMTISMFVLVASFTLNTISPILAGKFQVSTTVIKMIPLAIMAVVGTIVGLSNGVMIENFTTVVDPTVSTSTGLFTAVCATCFAYEGWIIATSINSELKDAKKNLPIALVGGTLIVMVTYVVYYIGLAGSIGNADLMALGEEGVKQAFTNLLGSAGATILMVFIVISVLGTENGLMLGGVRALYSLAARDLGPKQEMLKTVDKNTGMPTNSCVLGLFLSGFWLLYFYGANLTSTWFGVFTFDSSEIPIVTLYALYIPIFIQMIRKEKDLSVFKRVVMPIAGIIAALVMMTASIVSHGWANFYYFIVFAVVGIVGMFVMNKKAK